MKKRDNREIWILARYLILLGLMFSLPFIYKIFTPITVYPVVWLLKLFFSRIDYIQDIILINNLISIKIIPACIAGSAYLLLLILNLSVPMNNKKRFYSILSSLGMLLLLNIFRIFILSVLYVNNFVFFDFTHKLFWYFLSTVFVVGIWFFVIKIFGIKEVPVWSDIKSLLKKIKFSKNSK